MHLTVLCVTFPPPPPRFQRKCRAPNHRGPNPHELPTTVVSAGNFLRSSVRETQRVLEMKRGLNVNGLVGDPISWANRMSRTWLKIWIGWIFFCQSWLFCFFLSEPNFAKIWSGWKQKKHCLWWLAALASPLPSMAGFQPRSVTGAMRSRRFGLKGMESAESSFWWKGCLPKKFGWYLLLLFINYMIISTIFRELFLMYPSWELAKSSTCTDRIGTSNSNKKNHTRGRKIHHTWPTWPTWDVPGRKLGSIWSMGYKQFINMCKWG